MKKLGSNKSYTFSSKEAMPFLTKVLGKEPSLEGSPRHYYYENYLDLRRNLISQDRKVHFQMALFS